MNLFVYSLLSLLLLLGMTSSRPAMQRLLINNHVWEVPNEPGWEGVIEDAESARNLLHECKTTSECRAAVKHLREIFHRHSVSKQYYQKNTKGAEDLLNSIFKWG